MLCQETTKHTPCLVIHRLNRAQRHCHQAFWTSLSSVLWLGFFFHPPPCHYTGLGFAATLPLVIIQLALGLGFAATLHTEPILYWPGRLLVSHSPLEWRGGHAVFNQYYIENKAHMVVTHPAASTALGLRRRRFLSLATPLTVTASAPLCRSCG